MNKQWEMKAFLPENESHFSCFDPTSPCRTIHLNGAEADVCFRRRTCAVIFQPCRGIFDFRKNILVPRASVSFGHVVGETEGSGSSNYRMSVNHGHPLAHA